MKENRVVRAIAGAIALYVLVMVFARMRYGVDFTDEAFYVALPYRFALGDRPFIDELNITQTAALIIYPIIKVYVAIAGTSRIILFVRCLLVCLLAFVGWNVFQTTRRKLPDAAAVLVGATALCFIPYGLPGLGYNMLGAACLAIGLFCAARGILARGSPRLLADSLTWSGFALAAAALAYPGMMLAVIVSGLLVLILASHARIRSVLRFSAGGFAFAAFVAPAFLNAGVAQVKEAIHYTSQNQGGPIHTDKEHFWTLLDAFLAEHPQLWKCAAIAGAAIAIGRRWPLLGLFAIPVIPYFALGSLSTTGNNVVPYVPLASNMANMSYVSAFAALGPLFALAMHDGRVSRVLFLMVWVPSAVAGLASAWSSSNGVVASAMGLYAAMLATVAMMAMWIHDTALRCRWQSLRLVATFGPATCLHVLFALALADGAVYRDGPLSTLTETVGNGPYKGIKTTAQKRGWLAAVAFDLDRYARGNRILFYYDFPAGYLIAQKPPATASAWIFGIESRGPYEASAFLRLSSPGELVFQLDGWNPPGAIAVTLAENTEPIGKGDNYHLYRVRPR